MRYCCVSKCGYYQGKDPLVTFHKFPLKESERLEQWIRAVNRDNFKPTKHTVICSSHFQESDYLESSLRGNLLKKDAVPSVFSYSKHTVLRETNMNHIILHQPVFKEPTEVLLYNPVMHEIETKTVGVQTDMIGSSIQSMLSQIRRDKKILQQRLKRSHLKVKKMKELVKALKFQKTTNSRVVSVVKNNRCDVPKELFKNKVKNSSYHRYTRDLKKFALTLYAYSPKCYKFLQKCFFLPSSSTLRRLLSTPKCDDLLYEVLEHLDTAASNSEVDKLESVQPSV